jgi:Flp pilus assembly protein TadG
MMDRLRIRRRHAHASKTGRVNGGQSLVELAIALPLLLLLMLGTIDIGRAFFDYVQIRNAAREGAGYGAHFPTDTAGIQTRVTRHGVPAGTTVTVECTNCAASGGTVTGSGTVKVTVRRTFTPITLGFLQSWFGMQPMTLTASATMRVLQ